MHTLVNVPGQATALAAGLLPGKAGSSFRVWAPYAPVAHSTGWTMPNLAPDAHHVRSNGPALRSDIGPHCRSGRYRCLKNRKEMIRIQFRRLEACVESPMKILLSATGL